MMQISQREKIVFFILATVITIFVVYLTVRFVTNDIEYIVPGWHTTIYPREVVWVALTTIILVAFPVVYLIFKVTAKLWTSMRVSPK